MAEISPNLFVSKSRYIPFSMYGELIKGKQTFLLIYTAVFTYLISSYPDPMMTKLAVLLGSLFFAVSGSTLLNMYIDRDIDAIMPRTQHRAIPSGRISKSTVLNHGILFSVVGTVAPVIFLNLMTGIVIAAGVFFDVVVYSMWLKRRTKWSIVFGGIAGGLPAMAGRTAVTGTIDLVAVFFFLFILLWIPLHILTLATLPKNFQGYKEAGVPMWPVAAGIRETLFVITFAAFLDGILLMTTGLFIGLHLIAQIPLILFGAVIIKYAVDNFRRPDEKTTFTLFKFASMFMAMAYLWMYVGVILTNTVLH